MAGESLTPRQIELVMRMWRRGCSKAQIAATVNRHPSTVSRVIAEREGAGRQVAG